MKLEHGSASGVLESRDSKHGLDRSTQAIVLIEPWEDRIVDANMSACSLLGYSHNELLRTRVSQVHPDDMAVLLEFSRSVARFGYGWARDIACRTKNGESVPSEVSASAVGDSGGDLIMAVIRGRLDQPTGMRLGLGKGEVDDLERSGLAQTDDRGRLILMAGVHAQILDALDQGVVLIDPHMRIVVVNTSAARLLGGKPEMLRGQDVGEILEIRASRNSLAHPREAVLTALEEGRALPLGAITLLNADGLQVPVQMACSPLRNDSGVVGSVMTMRPVGMDNAFSHRLVPPPYGGGERGESDQAHATLKFDDMVGETAKMRRLREQIAKVAPTHAAVLITGESGTGKELVARAIHKSSLRGAKPFIKVNCSTVPRELFESEFFGHAKGAFTGAVSDRRGRFELADGGTLFLDEIGELPIEMQSKLLGVIEDGRFERIGDSRSRNVNVRIIAATNRELETEIEAGRFRLDLYYRLKVFPVHVPPLRDRKEDIPLLVEHMLAATLRRLGRPKQVPLADQLDRLMAYDWPGNVRELQNLIEYAVITARGGEPLHFDLPKAASRLVSPHDKAGVSGILNETERRAAERNSIVFALERTGGRIGGPGGAAELLGVRPTTLRSRIKAFNIEISRVARVRDGEGRAASRETAVDARAEGVSSGPEAIERERTISLAWINHSKKTL